jgi:hypothetical protein
MDTVLEYIWPDSVAEADFLLVVIFGIAFLDKARDEFRLVYITDRLSDATERTPLGWAYRNKSLTLGWLVLALGVVFVLRGIPGFDEPRWVVILIRASSLSALLWNKMWRRRAMRELERRLDVATSSIDGLP